MANYDSIIIGAGHNGLVCAAYLAQSGQRVLVLEAEAQPGGLAASHEFHPGYRVPIAHSAGHFSGQVAEDLKLAWHGYSAGANLATVGLGAGGNNVVVNDASLEGASKTDAAAYRDYRALMATFADVLKPFWHKTMPRIGSKSVGDLMTFAHIGLNLRRLGKKDMREFLRVVSLPVRDLMDERFENDLVKATLGWDGLIGAKMAPRSPNSSVLAMLYRMEEASRGAHSIPAGGVAALASALGKSAEASGAEIHCSAEVARVLINESAEGLTVRGVRLTDGEEIDAQRVISATDPKRTFLNLVGVEHFDIGFTNRIRRLRCDGYVGKLHLALDGMPQFDGIERPAGRMIIAPELDAIEFAFDHAKYGECPENPVMELLVPSIHDATCAPDGKHVLSAHVMYIPHKLKGGWTDDARNAMRDRAVDTIAQYAPGIRDQIVGQEFLTPADIERTHRVTGGHWHHTEFAMDQMLMMRPTHEAAQYSTPLPGLYLCGAGSHPGGDLTGAPGRNAAREILR